MKKSFYLTFLCSILLLKISAQVNVPNPSFDQFNTDGTIRNWGNVYLFSVAIDSSGNQFGDSIYLDFNYYFPTQNAHSGEYAIELRNSYNYTTQQGRAGAIVADLDSVFTAWSSFETIPVSQNPKEFSFYYQYYPVNGDTGLAEVIVFDSLMEEIGHSTVILSEMKDTYTYSSDVIDFNLETEAAAVLIKFSTFYTTVPDVRTASLGTRLVIDDVALSTSTGFNLLNVDKNQVQVYPNPTSGYLYIHSKELTPSKINVYNQMGQLVLAETITPNQNAISTTSLAKGIYTLSVENAGSKSMHKIVVQ
jgi:hypothetical protein